MVKIVKYMIVFILFGATIGLITFGALDNQTNEGLLQEIEPNFPYIEDLLLSSSRYTQTDEVDPERLNDYENQYKINYTEQEIALMGFEKVLENSRFELYFESISYSILLYDKTLDFFWSSRGEGLVLQDANLDTRNRINSGIIIDYATLQRPDIVRTESVLSITGANYQTNNEELPERIRPYVLNMNTIDTQFIELSHHIDGDTIFTHVNFKKHRQGAFSLDLGFEFDLELSLTEEGIEIFIPAESILDQNTQYRILSISVLPYFGAAKQDRIPGYFVVPDQIGALIRLDRFYRLQIPEMPFYSEDYGYRSAQNATVLTMPMFGVVHQVDKFGFYAEVLEGAQTSSLQLALWNQNSQFQRINVRYQLRKLYRTVIDRAGNGTPSILDSAPLSDFKVRYYMLAADDASYVGMAKDYRTKLIDRGILSDKERIQNDQIPFQTTLLLSDQEPSFFGTAKVAMTTLDQAKDIYDELKALGITNQQVYLQGWSHDGNLLKTPASFSLVENENHFKDFSAYVKADQNYLFLENNYILGTNDSPRLNYYADIAYGLNKLRMSFTSLTASRERIEHVMIYPHRSFELLRDDLAWIEKLGVSGMHHRSLGSMTTSYYEHGTVYPASESMYYYETMASLTEHTSLERPNVYLWEHMDLYTQMNIANAQYNYYTDLVPLVPLILKGSVSYFGSYLNFNVLGKELLLQMIDFGMNPSYLFTYEPTYQMRYTPSSIYFTTEFNQYKDEVSEVYTYINNALKHVLGESIDDREVLATGLVRVTYSNGVQIYINYQSNEVSSDGITIPAYDYRVVI